MNSIFQHATPFWIDSLAKPLDGKLLSRIEFKSVSGSIDIFDEEWIQRLLHRFPQSLPVTELEPALSGILPVGRELPTPSGPVDNVFITNNGGIILVECKLWRSSEARRKVVSQIIDYAQSMSGWRYEDFDAAVRNSLDENGKKVAKSLVEIVGVAGDFDEAAFVDAVSKNLRMGRMLLLIVGDGIREDTESLANFLQKHAGFHFSLSLIEFSVFKLPDGSFVVNPRVLARTLNIERGVVRVAGTSLEVVASEDTKESGVQARPTSMTEEMFYERLETCSAEGAKLLRQLMKRDDVADLGIFLGPATKSAALKWEARDGTVFNLGGISVDGEMTTSAVCWVSNHPERLEMAHAYLKKLAHLLDGEVRETRDPSQWYVVLVRDGKKVLPAAVDILSRGADWVEIIKSYQAELSKTIQEAR